jgi:hypothetical protein
MALLPPPNPSGSSLITKSNLSSATPWRDLSPAVAGQQVVAGGAAGIAVWSLNLAETPAALGPLPTWEVPFPGTYRHLVHATQRVLTTVQRHTGGAELGVSGRGSPYARLVQDSVGITVDLDRSGQLDRAAVWLGTQPKHIEVVDTRQLLHGNVAGLTVDLTAQFDSAFPNGVEVVQLCLHGQSLGVLAQAPGFGQSQAFFSITLNPVAVRFQQGGLAGAFIAVNDDTGIWGTDFNQAPGGLRPKATGSNYQLWYTGPHSPSAGRPELLFDVAGPGFEYHYPFLQDDVLVFTEAWPLGSGLPRSVRKTAVHAYPLALLGARDPHCIEFTDASIWTESGPVSAASHLAPGRGLVTVLQKPSPQRGPIVSLVAASFDY